MTCFTLQSFLIIICLSCFQTCSEVQTFSRNYCSETFSRTSFCQPPHLDVWENSQTKPNVRIQQGNSQQESGKTTRFMSCLLNVPDIFLLLRTRLAPIISCCVLHMWKMFWSFSRVPRLNTALETSWCLFQNKWLVSWVIQDCSDGRSVISAQQYFN